MIVLFKRKIIVPIRLVNREERTARYLHYCDYCDFPIFSGDSYEREVWVQGNRLWVKKIHFCPGCHYDPPEEDDYRKNDDVTFSHAA